MATFKKEDCISRKQALDIIKSAESIYEIEERICTLESAIPTITCKDCKWSVAIDENACTCKHFPNYTFAWCNDCNLADLKGGEK